MGKLLQFPINRVVRSIPEAPELSEEEQEEITGVIDESEDEETILAADDPEINYLNDQTEIITKAYNDRIDAIEAATDDGFQYYLQGNILKYIWRYRYKGGKEDLEKAQWYLTKLIDVVK